MKPLGEVGRGVFASAFVEEDDVVARLEAAQQFASFALALLLTCKAAGVAHIGDDTQLKRGIAGCSSQIILDGRGEVGIVGLADDEKEGLQGIRN